MNDTDTFGTLPNPNKKAGPNEDMQHMLRLFMALAVALGVTAKQYFDVLNDEEKMMPFVDELNALMSKRQNNK